MRVGKDSAGQAQGLAVHWRWQALENSWVLAQAKNQRRFTAQNGSNPTDHHQGDGTSHMIGELRLGDKKKEDTDRRYHVDEPHGHAAG